VRTPSVVYRRGIGPLVFLIDPAAYCVPEAGINYKRQIDARGSHWEVLANFPAMS
jgi:hypothetical protein